MVINGNKLGINSAKSWFDRSDKLVFFKDINVKKGHYVVIFI